MYGDLGGVHCRVDYLTTTLTSFSGTTTTLTTSWPLRCWTHARCGERQLLELIAIGATRRLHAVTDLAVDLADELEGVGHQHRRVGGRPRLLPDAAAGQLLEDLGAQVRREWEDQRRGRRDRKAPRLGVRLADSGRGR